MVGYSGNHPGDPGNRGYTGYTLVTMVTEERPELPWLPWLHRKDSGNHDRCDTVDYPGFMVTPGYRGRTLVTEEGP